MDFSKPVIITEVLEKDNLTPRQDTQYRVGREGVLIHKPTIGRACLLQYINNPELEGKAMWTTSVENIEETENWVKVTTKNTIYRFEVIEWI